MYWKIFCFGLSVLLLSTFAMAQGGDGELDHRGIISAWNEESLTRGEKLYQSCTGCHGVDGNTPPHPAARAFGRDAFKFGSDPYSMYRTLTFGSGAMLAQTWLSPAERYDVIHYVREKLIRPTNEAAYATITPGYLDSLPKGTWLGAREGRGTRDYGPVLMSQIERRVNRGVTFFLSDNVHVSYDLHRLALSDVWRGELDLSETQHMRLRGERQPVPKGEKFSGLGDWYWCVGEGLEAPPLLRGDRGIDGSEPSSPLPEEQARYSGRYVHGRHAALAYTIGTREVLEMPAVEELDGVPLLHHTLLIGPGEKSIRLCVGRHGEDGWPIQAVFPLFGPGGNDDENGVAAAVAVSGTEDDRGQYGAFFAASVVGDTEGMQWEFDDAQRLGITIPPAKEALRIRVYRIAGDGPGVLEGFVRRMTARHEEGDIALPDMEAFLRGGPRIWRDTIVTPILLNDRKLHYRSEDYEESPRRRARLGFAAHEHVPYAMDTIALPEPNPWNAWMRMSALDFFDDGRAVVSTLGGDVWIVEGLGEGSTEARWTRFASGMFEPLGLKIVDEAIYVMCRGGIVKLYDLNDDGQADYYENFFADPNVSNGFHAYNFDLETDTEGNFYYIKPGLYTDFPLPGAMVKVSPDGKRGEFFTGGFRVPNGVTMAEGDVLYASDNQGQWVPANKINRIKGDAFYGVSQSDDALQDSFEPPMMWLPQEFDNSPGDMGIADATRFGPLSGRLINTSFGKGWLYYIIPQSVGDSLQGAAVAFPFQFQAGVQRAMSNPGDGHMYTVGLTGWDTESTYAEGCFQRIRYTGEAGCMVTEAKVVNGGIELAFSSALDEGKLYPSKVEVLQWNYRWTAEYGSEDYSVENPRREGRDEREVEGFEVSEGGKRVRIVIPDLTPAHTTRLTIETESTTGIPVREAVYLTIHELP